MRPIHIRPYMRKSEIRLRSGWPKLAGRFFSIQKCPSQAKAYAVTGAASKNHKL
jgi:hypothetical protein